MNKEGWLNSGSKSWYLNSHTGEMMKDAWIAGTKDGKTFFDYANGDGLWTKSAAQAPAAPAGLQALPNGMLLESNPEKVFDLGWAVQTNGKIGLLKPDGTWLLKREYNSVIFDGPNQIDDSSLDN